MRIALDPCSVADYETFLKVKALPSYRCRGSAVEFPDEYAHLLGRSAQKHSRKFTPSEFLFDYQKAIASLSVQKQRFCVFADCGLGKTVIFLDYIRHVAKVLPKHRRILIVSPLMVVAQTLDEAKRFYGDSIPIEQIRAADLDQFLGGKMSRIGITNYEAIRPELNQGTLGCLILDESSMLKSHYGKWGTKCLELGRGLDWKLCLTGTPAPNDRIEYANHAVFMGAFPTVNAFLGKFFVNRGQTDNRWELKPHALKPFYQALSHWSIFLANPATYGWKDNSKPLPTIHVHIHDVDITAQQRTALNDATGALFATNVGGITSRIALSRIAKGNGRHGKIDTLKPKFIRDLVSQWPSEGTIIWCLYNAEQQGLAKMFPEAASVSGDTPYEDRRTMIDDFKAGRIKVLITKPKILGFGLNLQVATRQVFSGLQDSYESYYQAVKRSNRYGATKPLNVHIPMTELERPMIDTVLEKSRRIQQDTEEQERIFRDALSQ